MRLCHIGYANNNHCTEQTFTLDVEPSDNIETVKGLVEQQTSIAQARQIITFNGKVLERSLLSDWHVQKNSTLNVTKSNAARGFELIVLGSK